MTIIILYNYLYRIRERGVTVPVVAGIMPVTSALQIKRICQMSGTYLPSRFKAIVDRFGDNPAAMKQAGIAYATEQIIDLIANGVNGIHIYSMNKPDVAEKIWRACRRFWAEGMNRKKHRRIRRMAALSGGFWHRGQA